MLKKLFLLFFVFVAMAVNAQEAPQMADALRENGKIYVVISVIAIIFMALVSFLIYLERKVKRLEDKINKS